MAKRKSKAKQKKNQSYVVTFVVAILVLFSLYYIFSNLGNRNKTVEKTKVATVKLEDKPSVNDAIVHARTLLGVPESEYKTYIGEDAVYIRIGIDRNKLDLTFANMIVTGKVEEMGGKLLEGKKKSGGNKQVLKFKDPEDKQIYVVTLFYTGVSSFSNKTKLAILVDDFGTKNDKLLDDFCALDKNITFAIMPDLTHSQTVMNQAAETGHETIIHIPMEPVSYPRNNPGTNAIYVHQDEKEIRKRMAKFIKQFPNCKGANNHMGSLVTADEDIMKIVLSVLKEHDMFFIDSRTTQVSKAYSTARKMMIPTFENNFFLDSPDISMKTLDAKVKQLNKMSETHDRILVITHCATQGRLDYLRKFLEKIEGNGFELVPVSGIFQNEVPNIL